MSKLRRGLLTAGLATAVVGATGIVWTLNASAAETARPAPSIMESTPAADAEPTPPKLLPWGAKPTALKVGRPGANSRSVAAAGADAAPSDTSGSVLPTAEFAPKGRLSADGGLRRELTTVVPPAPPSEATPVAKAAPEETPVIYHYARGRQRGETDGSWANIHIAKPKLHERDYHSLAEIAVQSGDGKQTVEVGWTVDRTVNGDDDPHLFVFYWRDGEPTCYNACGFVQVSKNVKPGDTLPLEGQKRFGIQHFDGVWWVAYNSEFIGYFPDKLWGGTYTRAGLVQWFGEVASPSELPCSEMGNGIPATSEYAIRVGTISQNNGPEPQASFLEGADKMPYPAVRLTDRTFRFGGPGPGTLVEKSVC